MGLHDDGLALALHVAAESDVHVAAGYQRGPAGRRRFEQATPPEIDPASDDPTVAHLNDRWLRTPA